MMTTLAERLRQSIRHRTRSNENKTDTCFITVLIFQGVRALLPSAPSASIRNPREPTKLRTIGTDFFKSDGRNFVYVCLAGLPLPKKNEDLHPALVRALKILSEDQHLVQLCFDIDHLDPGDGFADAIAPSPAPQLYASVELLELLEL